MKKIKFSVIILLTLLIGACKKTTDRTIKTNPLVKISSSNTINNPIIREHEVFDGWLKVSTEQQIIEKKLGLPEKKGENEYWDATGTYIQNWEYPSLGIVLEMESDSIGGSKNVYSITVVKPCKLRTLQGIGILSNEGTVREKYLKLIDASSSNSKTIVVGSIYGGTVFTLDGGVVTKIFIGSSAE